MDGTLETPVYTGAEGAKRVLPPISQAKGQRHSPSLGPAAVVSGRGVSLLWERTFGLCSPFVLSTQNV